MSRYSFQHSIKSRAGTNDDLLIQVLDGLLSRYLDRVPDASRIVAIVQARGDRIINDHIAFRSIHIESILTIFLHLGYEVRFDHSTGQPFNFEQKKLTAVWLKHPNKNVPRIFVSQFRFTEGSEQLQKIIGKYLKDWKDPINDLDLNDAQAINEYLHTAQWPTPTYSDYLEIQKESEYVAWVLFNKYYLNHFTLSIHELSSFEFESDLVEVINNYQKSYHKTKSLDVIVDAQNMLFRKYRKHFKAFNDFLFDHKFHMNSVGDGVMNISPDHCLLQSSTKANEIMASFPDGNYSVPGSYVEFAYRGFSKDTITKLVRANVPIIDLSIENRRDGFETQNADRIFESTYLGKETIINNSQSAYVDSCKKIINFLNHFNEYN
ncbi:MAG: DUF1338 domain-containing protein [Candidatus Margulisiibacteriota bacterium]